MHFAIRSFNSAAVRSAPRGAVPALGLLLLLGACAAPEGTTTTGSSSSAWVPFSTARNTVDVDSLTAQRVRGGNPEFIPVAAEPGNVWPPQEAPRPTLLGGPEEAMQNIPEYRPQLIQGAPPARSPLSGPPERGLPGSGSVSAPPPLPPQATPRATAQPPSSTGSPPPPRGLLTDPSGRPAVSTGQAGSVQGFTQPGGGSGAVVRDGNVETWIGPDGQARTRVVPR